MFINIIRIFILIISIIVSIIFGFVVPSSISIVTCSFRVYGVCGFEQTSRGFRRVRDSCVSRETFSSMRPDYLEVHG